MIEEHIFYPRTRELMKDMVGESFEEHAVARFPKVNKNLEATELTDLGVKMKIAFDSAVAKGYAAFVSATPGSNTKRPVIHDGVHAAH